MTDSVAALFSHGNITAPSVTIAPSMPASSTEFPGIFLAITNVSLRHYCESSLEAKASAYENSATSIVSIRTITQNYEDCTNYSNAPASKKTINTTIYETYTFVPSFIPVAAPPCCASCSIFAHSVQIRYWPTPAPSPPVTEVVEDGFT